MSRWIGWAPGLALCAMLGGAAAATVRVESGTLEGKSVGGLIVYKGVPFAAPPLADLRWKEPQPAAAWTGVRKADAFAPACPQSDVSMPGESLPPVNEDCLYLNIWGPPAAAKRRLPVLAWIHGGGYGSGSASLPLYWGDHLARKGIIVVTIAYRLGALGYLAHPELTRESPHRSSGNYGLMDQIAALQWIQSNIASFGGDPGRVTVAGQSAGAMSVSMLIASPRAKGLFHAAIAESGGLFEPTLLAPSYLLANAERDGERFLAAVGSDSIHALRQMPAEKLLGAAAAPITHPVIEPYSLPVSPYDAYVSGQESRVPVLIGSNAAEARALVNVSTVTASRFVADIETAFGPLPPSLYAAYPHATDRQAQEGRLGLERDLRFGWDMWAWARLQSAAARQPAYYYCFDQKPPFPADSIYAGWGASHYAELWYVFDHIDQARWKWTQGDRALAGAMSAYWLNFVKAGNPNGPGLPTWPRYAEGTRTVMHLRYPMAAGVAANGAALAVFDAVYESVRAAPFGKAK